MFESSFELISKIHPKHFPRKEVEHVSTRNKLSAEKTGRDSSQTTRRQYNKIDGNTLGICRLVSFLL